MKLGRGINLTLIFSLCIGCKSKLSNSPHDKIIEYEKKARTFQSLHEIQRLSPPYTNFNNNNIRNHMHNEHLRMSYLQEARRYRNMAKEIRQKLSPDANRTIKNLK